MFIVKQLFPHIGSALRRMPFSGTAFYHIYKSDAYIP
jgi:hypothetical protein